MSDGRIFLLFLAGMALYFLLGFALACIAVFAKGEREPFDSPVFLIVMVWPFLLITAAVERLIVHPAGKLLDKLAKARELSKLPPANSMIHGTLEVPEDKLANVDWPDEQYAKIRKQWEEARKKETPNLDKKGIRFLS